MPVELDLEIRFAAEDLYVKERLTYEQVADRLNIAVNTVRKWGKEDDWKQMRADRLAAARKLNAQLFDLRMALMEHAANNIGDPNAVYAALKAEKLALERQAAQARAAGGGREPDVDRPKMFLEALEFVAGYLKDNDPEALKCLARNFEPMVAAFKESLNA